MSKTLSFCFVRGFYRSPTTWSQTALRLSAVRQWLALKIPVYSAPCPQNWQYTRKLAVWRPFLSVKTRTMTVSDTRGCEMATGTRPTYFLSAGYIRVSCGLYWPPVGVLRWHQRAHTRTLLGQNFEHAQNLSVGKSDLRAHLRASPDEIRVKYWQARTFCRELRAVKIFFFLASMMSIKFLFTKWYHSKGWTEETLWNLATKATIWRICTD